MATAEPDSTHQETKEGTENVNPESQRSDGEESDESSSDSGSDADVVEDSEPVERETTSKKRGRDDPSGDEAPPEPPPSYKTRRRVTVLPGTDSYDAAVLASFDFIGLDS